MKIIKKDGVGEAQIRTITLRLSEKILNEIDRVSNKNDISRQKLIESILAQVLADKNFELIL